MNFTKQDFEKILAYINRRSAKDSSFPVLSEVGDSINVPVLSNGSNRLLPLERLIDYLSRHIDAARIPVDVSGLEGSTLLDVLNELYVIAKTDKVIDLETGEGLVLPSEDITYTKSGFNFNDVKTALDTLFDLMSSKADDDDVTSAIGNISTALANKADLETTSRKVLYNQMPSVILRYIAKSTTDTEASHTLSEGDVYYGSTGYLSLYTNSAPHSLGTPNKGLIYYCIEDGKYYKYDSRFSWTEIGVSGSDDGQGSGSPDLSTILGGDGKIRSALAPACVMYITDSVPNITNVPVHSYYCLLSTRPQDVNIYYRDEVVTGYITQFNDILIGQPQTNVIYYDIVTDKFYRWQLSKFVNLTHNASLGDDGRVVPTQATAVVLKYIASVNNTNIPQLNTGDVYCDQSNILWVKGSSYGPDIAPISHTSENGIIEVGSPDSHLIYYNIHTNGFYKWSGRAWDMIGSSGDGTITSIMMNGSVVPESEGTVNLGTVVTDISGKTDKASDSRLQSSQATAVILKYINGKITDDEGNESTEGYINNPPLVGEGDVFFSGNHISVKVAGNSINLGEPDGSIIYYNLYTKKFYRWKGTDSGWGEVGVTVDSSGFVLKNDLVITTNGDKTTITLGQGKTTQVINQHQSLSSYATKSYVDQAVQQAGQGETVVINSDGANIVDEHNNNSVLVAPSARQMKLMYDNFMAVYNSLANIAFTNGKPSLDWIGTKTKYTLSYGTMTGCTADVAAGQVNEGGLRIKLTPTQSSYAFTSVTVNGDSVSTMATGDADGSVYIDIIVNGNITVAATAISGRAINFNGTGCSIGAAGVAIGQDLDTTITANEHFTLPESITVKIGNANVTHSYTRAQGNKTATLHIDAANITGDLAVTCTAVEDNHAVLTIGQLSNVTIKSGTRNLESGSHIYDGDTISIKPTNGYKLTGKPVFTNGSTTPVTLNPTTESGDIYNGYDFVFNPISNSTIAITNVGATELDHNLRASLTGTGSESVDSTTDLSSNITEGSAWSTVLSVKSTAEEGTAITSVSPAMEGGGTIIYDTNTKRVHTDCVTGNITITVTVAGVVKHNVSWQGSGFKMYADTNHNTELTSPVQVNEGSSFTAYIAADEDVTIDSVTGASYNSSTGLVQISNVSANVVISVSTTNSNPDYRNIRADGKTYIWGDSSEYFMSKLIPLGVRGENDDESDGLSVAFKTSWNTTGAVNGKLLFFLSDKSYSDSYGADPTEKTVAPINKYKYARLTGTIAALANAYVKINGTTVWNGAQKYITDFEPPENFMTNPLSEAEIDGQGVRKKTMHTYPDATSYYGYPDNAKKGLLGAALITAPASTWDFALTQKYEIPKKVVGSSTTTRKLKVSIKSHNSAISDRTSYIRLEKIENGEVKKSAYINSQSSAFDIDLSSLVFVQGGTIYTEGDTLAEGAETVNGTEFTHVQMCFNYANKSSCYIKYYDDSDELIDIWNGNPQT